MNSFFIKLVIADALNEIDENLDLNGIDSLLLKTCVIDFIGYMSYLKNNCPIKTKRKESVAVKIFPHGFAHITFSNANMDEDREFIKQWVEWWWAKYKKRVKLYLEDKPNNEAVFKIAEKKFTKIFTRAEQFDLLEMVSKTFIKHGDIAFSMPLALNLIFTTLLRTSSDVKWTKEIKMRFVVSMVNKARKMSHMKGPLLFLKPNVKDSRLREIDFDGTQHL